MTLSLILLVLGLFAFLRIQPQKCAAYLLLKLMLYLLIMLLALLFVIYIASDALTGEGVNEATIYHLRFGFDGAGWRDYTDLIITCSLVILAGALLLFLIDRNAKDRAAKSSQGRSQLTISTYLIALTITSSALLAHPTTQSIYIYSLRPVFNEYLLNISYEDGAKIRSEFARLFLQPKLDDRPTEPKNFVWIYAEGLERTFLDENLFPNLAPNLKRLEATAVSFTEIEQLPATGWTIAGIVASQCGFPMFTNSQANSMSGMDKFLPSATCLGDLLEEKGYKMAFIGGADLGFAGKGNFLHSHGFTDVLGRDELLALESEHNLSPWGLYDDSLLDRAYKEFARLSQNDNRFGLVILTLDTHGRTGMPSPSCKAIEYADGSNSYLNAVACSDKLISDFIRRILGSPYAANTTIILSSDHLSLPNSATAQLNRGRRRNLFMILNPSATQGQIIESPGSTLDQGVTILPHINLGGQIGLGRDLINAKNKPSLQAEINFIKKNITSWRSAIAKFWNFPRLGGSMVISPQTKTIEIGGRTFRFPVLIKLEQTMQTELSFEFDYLAGSPHLIDYLRSFRPDTPFVIVDLCSRVRFGHLAQPSGDSYCLVAGRGSQFLKVQPVFDRTELKARDIQKMLSIISGIDVAPVAHAGGGYNGQTYTKSYEALDYSIASGFNHFEIDLIATSDGHLVCLHDWEGDFTKSFKRSAQHVPTLLEFDRLNQEASESGTKKCTLAGLAGWMADNPSAILITDIKSDNLEGLKQVYATIPDASRRVIPQIYFPGEFEAVKALGFDSVIWTLYRYQGSTSEVLSNIKDFYGPIAVTMNEKRAQTDLPSMLCQMSIPAYVHTINSIEDVKEFAKWRHDVNIYTDFLAPDDIDRVLNDNLN